MFILTLVFYLVAAATAAETEETKNGKSFSVLNVIRFPNTDCMGTGSLNGTCYTASECTSLGGAASGACASSFGVCCVFSLSCGGSTTANTSYAMVSSFSTTTSTDPCAYKYCKNNDDVCKLRIDFESLVIAGPDDLSGADATSQTTYAPSGNNLGDCNTDTLSVGVPGYSSPPVICGYNTGQHMWVPASASCVTINIDVDTASTSTTRSWNIKVTQYECGNLRAPEENCLQYHTATTGTIASFNWDTSSTSNAKTELQKQIHLSDQHYDICIRRSRGYCSVCYSPQVVPAITGGAAAGAANEGSSFGISAGGDADEIGGATGTSCKGVTTHTVIYTTVSGFGDYLTIGNLQPGTGTAGAAGVDKICGLAWNADVSKVGTAGNEAYQLTACSFQTPFRVGVHFDSDEGVGTPATDDMAMNAIENAISTAQTEGEGTGYNGFWLAYWQNTC